MNPRHVFVFAALAMSGAVLEAGESPRFSDEVLELFATGSTRYFLNEHLSADPGDPLPHLRHLGDSADPLVVKGAGLCDGLRSNVTYQAEQNQRLLDEITGVTPTEDADPFLVVSNECTRAANEGRRLSRELRAKVAEICQRDQPKGAAVSPSLKVIFQPPGILLVTNTSTKPLNHCAITTSTTMYPDTAPVPFLNVKPKGQLPAGSPELQKREAARAAQLNKIAVNEERGFFVYVPKLAGGESVAVPFCDLTCLAAAHEVKLSFWSDEGSSAEAIVGGLVDFRQKAYNETKLWEEAGKQQPAYANQKFWEDPLLMSGRPRSKGGPLFPGAIPIIPGDSANADDRKTKVLGK